MASSLIDPKQWTLPNPERVLAALKSLRVDKPSSSRSGGSWVISPALSPVDLYAYLKSRFGPPNGFAMSLRTPSVDNFIHWQYTLECSDTVLDLTGLNMRTEIHAYSTEISLAEWGQLESNLQAAIAANQQVIQQTKKTFEHWHLFLNPYRRLSAIVDRWEGQSKTGSGLAIQHLSARGRPACRFAVRLSPLVVHPFGESDLKRDTLHASRATVFALASLLEALPALQDRQEDSTVAA